MDVSHGIGVTNRFDIFCNEDVDPYEILRQQDEEKQKRKIEKTQMKDKVKTTKPTRSIVTTASPKKPIENSSAKLTKDAGEVPNKPRGLKTTDRPPRNIGNYQEKETEKNSRNKDDHFFNPDQRDGEFRRGRGGYRGRGGRDRGRGFFPNSEGRPRRVFDRHSGSDKTGVRSVDKRDGAGPNNWGDIRSELNQRNNENTWDEEFESAGERPRESANWGEEDPNESGKFADDVPKVDSEIPIENQESKDNDQNDEQIQDVVKEMTLDEYKKEIEAKKSVHKFNIRKPGEGEDEKQWKKGYVLKKKVPIEEDEQDDEDEIEEEEYGRKAQQKVLLDFQFNFTDSRRGMRGRGRGGRNVSRGGAGRDGGNRDVAKEDRIRGGRGRESVKNKSGQQAPRVDDFNDFPSLNNA